MTKKVQNAGVWVESTLIESFQSASNVMSLRFKVPDWPGHIAGQHVDVRLTSSDGYMAERSYSIANPFNGDDTVELGVELLENAEVSPYLWTLKPGDKIEIRGPIGGHFIWRAESSQPLILIAGGSGMVPLMCMLRHHLADSKNIDRTIVFMISLRTLDRLLYADEIEKIRVGRPHIKFSITLTETAPPGWQGYSRRIDKEMFDAELGSLKNGEPEIYVCGPTKFVEVAAKILLDMGFEREVIKTERFGG